MQGHNHGGKNHLLMMGGIAGLIFVVLILLGKPVGEALLLALFAACPLMMVGMMFSMRGGGQQQNGVNGQQQNGGNDLRGHEAPADTQDSVKSSSPDSSSRNTTLR